VASYPTEVLADSPWGYWRLNEAVGTTARDSSGNNRHGTYTGDYILNYGGSNGGTVIDNGSPLFGSNTYVAPSAVFNFGTATVEAWIYLTAYPSAFKTRGSMLAGCLEGLNGNSNDKMLYITSTGMPAFYAYNNSNGGQNYLAGSTALSLNTWHHLVGTQNSTNSILYVDGVSVATVTNNSVGYSGYSNPNTFISGYDAGGRFDYMRMAQIDEVAFYPSALSAARIAIHYKTGMADRYSSYVLGDSPSAYWRLNETSGTTAADMISTRTMTKNGSVSFNQPGPIYPLAASANNKSMFFDGSGSYLETSNPLPSLTNWTAEAWVKPTASQQTYAAVVADIHPSEVNFALIWNWSGGTAAISAGMFSGSWSNTGQVELPLNKWSYVAGTYDGSNLRLYVNDLLVSTVACTATGISGGAGIRIGRRWDATNYTIGYISEVAIYDHALSQNAIAIHYRGGEYLIQTWDQYTFVPDPAFDNEYSLDFAIGQGGAAGYVTYPTSAYTIYPASAYTIL
jgi:hypothetical protein